MILYSLQFQRLRHVFHLHVDLTVYVERLMAKLCVLVYKALLEILQAVVLSVFEAQIVQHH